MRVLVVVVAALLFCATAAWASVELAPVLRAADPSERVDNEYVVLFRESLTSDAVARSIKALQSSFSAENRILKNFQIGEQFRAIHTYLTPEMVEKLRANPAVKLIEENQRMRASGETCTTQTDVIWNLERINEHDIALTDETYEYGYDGSGVDVYVVDTGILTTHVEFEGRATWGYNSADSTDSDCNGHGTHVAGTIGGRLYGVAKKANLIAVKVLNCGGSGTYAGVIEGIEYVAKQATSTKKPSVANMSLGGPKAETVNAAVNAAVEAGVVFAVAAGNERTDACSKSPASAADAITVGATGLEENDKGVEEDIRASFSNFGKCVDIFAPGHLIKAAWIDTSSGQPNNVYNTISGTSMASPHVAGAAAVILSESPSLSPAEVAERLIAESTSGVVDLACGSNAACGLSPNQLLYTSCH